MITKNINSVANVTTIQAIKVLWVGIGCKSGTSPELILIAIEETLKKNELAWSAIAGIATMDMKASEVGLRQLCHQRNLPLKTFSADVLSSVDVPNSSPVVALKIKTPSVAEAAALLAAKCQTLLIPKQIFKSTDHHENPSRSTLQGAVTIAVAQTQKEYI
ncbi:MAG: cobalamin biosynthesis protein [Tolypothrix brevis GSE-NOS-MK-07-07A]|jgi:cobalt-precorrin 5A hydrolase/precorrin-3B C17-methyltransferase|nr:cobalamin biosynthesis protein [Tolypothrix brevis GSE-NOS-MK-07-07A]